METIGRVASSQKLTLMAIALCALLLSSCSEDNDSVQEEKVVDITLAAEMSLLPATVWVAEKKGFFKKHNVNLTTREFDSGRNALETMLKDSTINIATVAQTPIVFNSFNNEPYVIVATMAYSLDDIKVLARKDRNINGPLDLRGKKIGATARSTGHYFLRSFLTHYDLRLSDIEMVDVNASELGDALISGALDAITSWEPHIHNAEAIMGAENLSLLISPTPFRKDFYFTTDRKYATENRAAVQQFLAAVSEAENYIRLNPQEAQGIVTERLGADAELIALVWDSFTFEITLDQSILVHLEDEALWAMGLAEEQKEIPNYLDFIDIRPLLAVDPFAVNLIH